MATAEQAADVRLDTHGIAPVPAADRDSTPLQQFWIWAGANIAPINWVLGALGIILGLSLVETLLVLVIGNLVGCSIFGAFCVMGSRTGVNQMTLSRAAFGRRGAYLPATAQLLMTMGWLGVNTWVVLDLALGVLTHLGIDHPGTGTQVRRRDRDHGHPGVIAIVGFYWIQAFEKWTVPIAAAIMLLMSILAWTKVDVVVGPLDRARRREVDVDHAADDRDRRRLGHHLALVVGRLHALHQAGHAGAQGVPLDGARRLRPDGLARLPRRLDRERRHERRPGRSS